LKEDLILVVAPEVLPHPLQGHWNRGNEIPMTCQALSQGGPIEQKSSFHWEGFGNGLNQENKLVSWVNVFGQVHMLLL